MPRPSYDHGATTEKLIGATIGEAFDRATALRPDADALVVRHQGIRWSWGELAARVEEFAVGLVALGLRPGDRLGIWSQNCAEWTVAQFAAAKAGLVLVTINPAYRVAELEYVLAKVGCTALILSPSLRSSDYIAILGALLPELAASRPGQLRSARLPSLRIVIRLGDERTPGMVNFADVPTLADDAARARLAAITPTLQFDDAINIQFTSGTTGHPKGATLSHHNILNNAWFVGAGMKLVDGDRLCIPVPLYHCFGMALGNITCALHGATMVYPSEVFEPVATLEAIAAERCAALYGVPTMFVAMLDHPDFARHDMASLRTGVIGASPCPVELMRRVVARMNMREVTLAYGMTETSPVSTQAATDDSLENKVATVGRVGPHVEVKIVDAAGRIVPRGETGEFCTRGYSVMLGYWDDPERTAEAIDAAGWMYTGDLATMDADGYVRIVGRLKDMVIRGGENIYPREVEEFLFGHPKVLDVQIVGVPDARYGEELCAWIRLRDGEDATVEDIYAFCRGRISHYKIPRYVFFVDGFPMTITGKVQKFAMRAQSIERLGLDTTVK